MVAVLVVVLMSMERGDWVVVVSFVRSLVDRWFPGRRLGYAVALTRTMLVGVDDCTAGFSSKVAIDMSFHPPFAAAAGATLTYISLPASPWLNYGFQDQSAFRSVNSQLRILFFVSTKP